MSSGNFQIAQDAKMLDKSIPLNNAGKVGMLKEIVKARLDELGRNPFEASRIGGLERSYVNDILIGKKKSIRADKVAGLARALDLPDSSGLVGAGGAAELWESLARVALNAWFVEDSRTAQDIFVIIREAVEAHSVIGTDLANPETLRKAVRSAVSEMLHQRRSEIDEAKLRLPGPQPVIQTGRKAPKM